MIRHRLVFASLFFLSLASALAQQPPQPPARGFDPATDPSGMYTFLKEGDFVQITLENGELSGYVSRFGDSDTDKGQFIDQFFDRGSLKDNQLYFKTKTVHGVWYECTGTISVVAGKQPGQEGYRVIKGTVKRHLTDASGGETVSERKVELTSFPADLGKP